MRPYELLTRETAKKLGCIPAMPTVFTTNGFGPNDAPIDREQQKKVIEFLLNGGVDAILVDGTTGEAATQTHEEQLGFISWTIGIVNGRVPVIAGASSNCTREAVSLTQGAMAAGASAVLHVKPYYNKPGPAGLLAHYSAIAETKAPFVTYSVSSRTGGGAIPIDVIAKLAEKYPNIIGHKEAEGDQQRFADLRGTCPKDFIIWSGDDAETALAMVSGNCDGVISVAANVAPQEIKIVVDTLAADPTNSYTLEKARGLKDLFDALFMPGEPNPQSVKTALAMMGIIDEAHFRLPMVPMQPENIEALGKVLFSFQLIQEVTIGGVTSEWHNTPSNQTVTPTG